MLNYFVCPCIFDIVFVSNPKEIDELIESGFLEVNFLILRDDSSLYICCKENIAFYL